MIDEKITYQEAADRLGMSYEWIRRKILKIVPYKGQPYLRPRRYKKTRTRSKLLVTPRLYEKLKDMIE